MESIKHIYQIGYGPSSSHTMGPRKGAEIFKDETKNASKYEAILYGSLAATGKGHLTDVAIKEAFSPIPVKIIFKMDEFLPKHPNAVKLKAFDKEGKIILEKIFYSIGGGKIIYGNENNSEEPVYKLTNMNDILKWCNENGASFWQYVNSSEQDDVWEHLVKVWDLMKDAVKRGLEAEGTLPGVLNLRRKASSYYIKAQRFKGTLKRRSLAFAFALSVAEENAAGNLVVTAPTCGSCGVLPAVLYLLQDNYNFSDQKIYRALATAGLIGNLVKFNASISGAKVGCQGEVGTACSMAAAASMQLFGGTPYQIEYAAEMGLEHHLGLTCDPIAGLVQVPCIERNAIATGRALDANNYAMLSDGNHMVSFDKVVNTLNKTGNDLPSLYKETSLGGLAVD